MKGRTCEVALYLSTGRVTARVFEGGRKVAETNWYLGRFPQSNPEAAAEIARARFEEWGKTYGAEGIAVSYREREEEEADEPPNSSQ